MTRTTKSSKKTGSEEASRKKSFDSTAAAVSQSTRCRNKDDFDTPNVQLQHKDSAEIDRWRILCRDARQGCSVVLQRLVDRAESAAEAAEKWTHLDAQSPPGIDPECLSLKTKALEILSIVCR